MTNLFEVPISSVNQLTPEQLVQVMRAILRSESQYAKLSPSCLTISERLTIADGGIDAEVCTGTDHAISTDCIFSSGLTGFQIKAGTSFKPWTNSSIRAELINKAGELCPEVARLVVRMGRYTVACSGHDLTPEQRNTAKEEISNVLASVGYPDYKDLIDVLGASQLAEFIERYPGIVSLVISDPIKEGWTLSEWQQDAHMSTEFVPSEEQTNLIQHIRDGILGEKKHIRILGEPGIGKTRLVLEALKDPLIAPYALYIRDGLDFGKTELFRRLLKSSYDKPLVIVIDELPERELSEIWRHLKGRCGHLKLISLDHGQDETRDNDIDQVYAPKLSDEIIKQILINELGDSNELDRWVGICDGSPRVAQAIAENLKANPGDLLRPPSTVPVWDRFVHGYGNADPALARQVDCVTQHLALFNRFGFESPVDNEAIYIAQMIAHVDPTIGWARFQEIVQSLRARRVMQGRHTLFFVPKALHLYLWLKFWKNYGRGFDFTATLNTMPESLHAWFMNMFKYADETAKHVIRDILRTDGIYANPSFLISSKGSRFICLLAESAPNDVMKLLEATIGTWSDTDLLAFEGDRQNIVWTLEKLAVWIPFTVRSIKILARLALNENSSYSNNATGTLAEIFKIGPQWAVTESSPQDRLPAMIALLRSDSVDGKKLGLKAMLVALNTRGFGSRIVGPEYQGLKERARLWEPETYNDWWNSCYLYFQTLVTETINWPTQMQSEISDALLSAIENQISCPPCTELAFEVLEKLIDDNAVPPSQLNSFFWRWLEFKDSDAKKNITLRLQNLQQCYTKRSLANRFQRYVIDLEYYEWDEGFRESHNKPKNRAKQLVNGLAKRIATNPEKISEIQHLLTVQCSTLALWHFSNVLAEYDIKRILQPTLLDIALKTKNHLCFRGFMSTVQKYDSALYAHTVNQLLNSQDTAWLGAITALISDYDAAHFELCLLALERNWIESGLFHSICFGSFWKAIEEAQLSRLLQFISKRKDQVSQQLLIDLLNTLPFDNTTLFTPQFVFDILSKSITNEDDSYDLRSYHWKEVCEKLIRWDSSQTTALLDLLLTEMGKSYQLSYDFYISPLALEIVRLDPSGAWQTIHKHFEKSLPDWRHDLLNWMGGNIYSFHSQNTPGAIKYLPIDEIIQWVEIDPEPRSSLIAHGAPQTLDDDGGGQLTREILSRYGQYRGVLSGISCRFHSGGWMGPTSVYLKGKRDTFRQWLTAYQQPEVVRWIESELEYFDRRIEHEEIQEERERFD